VIPHRSEAEVSEAAEEGAEEFDDAFERLFLRAYRVSFQIVRNRQDAEDVAMDTMARALRDWRRLNSPADGWVARVATNRSIDLWRRAKRRRTHDAMSPLAGPEDLTEDELALRQAVASLPRRQREVLALRYFLDLSEREIAAALGCTTGSVKQHASRGLASLRKQFVDGPAEGPAVPASSIDEGDPETSDV
jgi:RNA polymerase sigma factor (sigma-70 family)